MEGRFATQYHFIGNKLGGYDRNAWVGITEICTEHNKGQEKLIGNGVSKATFWISEYALASPCLSICRKSRDRRVRAVLGL